MFAEPFVYQIQLTADPGFVTTIKNHRFLTHFVSLKCFQEAGIEGMPAVNCSRLHYVMECLAFRFTIANRLTSSETSANHFSKQDAAAIDLRGQTLTDDIANGVGQSIPHLLFLVSAEQADDPVDGLTGINRVQGAENEMPCFGRGQSDFHCLAV